MFVYATDGQSNDAFSTDVALNLNATNEPPYIAHALNAAQRRVTEDGTGRGTPLVAYPINTLASAGRPDPVNDARMTMGVGDDGDPAFTLQSAHSHAVATLSQVRRLTPRECERLQGFPDDYTDIPWRGKEHAPDGPRYKALGNSMAVPVMKWIGERIQLVENLIAEEKK